MTGGWKPYSDKDFSPFSRARPAEPSETEAKVDALLGVLIQSARFKRRAIRVLREHGLSFVEWRVLRATHQEVRDNDDAVSQQGAARRAGVDDTSASKAMRRLSRRGLVDIGFDAWGWSQRVLVTREGEAAIEQLEALVASAGR